MRLVYIIGPYWSDLPARRALHRESAKLAAIQVIEAGHFPITPHLNTGGFEDLSTVPESHYLAGTMELLARCDCAYLAPGWRKSPGSLAEIEFCKENRIPFSASLHGILQPEPPILGVKPNEP